MSTALRTYYRGDELVGLRDGQANATRYYHFDHQGTTQCLTDKSGAVTDRFASDAWGVEVKRTGNSINRHWYVGNAGYYLSSQQPSLYIRLRHLSINGARWLAKDPLSISLIRGRSTGLSAYSYVDSDPANRIDPSGSISIKLLEFTCNKPCGHFLANWALLADIPHLCPAYFIQHVIRVLDVYNCTTQKNEHTVIETWEAFPYPSYTFVPGTGFIGTHDLWQIDADQSRHNTYGFYQASADMGFFCKDTVQGILDTWTKIPTTLGGAAYQTNSMPGLVLFRYFEGENPISHSASFSWDCCRGCNYGAVKAGGQQTECNVN